MKYIFTIALLFSIAHAQTTVMISMRNAQGIYGNLRGENLMYRFFDRQDTLSSGQACGNYASQNDTSVCWTSFYAPNTPEAQPYGTFPGVMTIKTNMRFKLDYTMVYAQSDNNLGPAHADSNGFRINGGTPFVWASSLADIKKDGITVLDKWLHIPYAGTDTLQYIQISSDYYAPLIREIVFYGTLIDTVAIPNVTFVKKNRPLTNVFGQNITYPDGIGKLSTTKADTNFQKNYRVLRTFGNFRYYLNSLDGFNNGGKGLGILEQIYHDIAYNAGAKQFWAFGGSVGLSQVSPAQLADSATFNSFITQLAIDYSFCAGTKEVAGIRQCNNCFYNPSSYRHTAWNNGRFAAILRNSSTPMYYYGLGNEYDLRDLGYGWYDCFSLAAMESALTDGHGNTLSWLGQSVGVLNASPTMRPVSVSWANWNPNRIYGQLHWDYWNRSDHSYPGNGKLIMDVHLYPTTAGMQGIGVNGRGLPPENSTWNLLGRVRFMQRLTDSLNCDWACTEFGYGDTINCPVNTSFVRVDSIPGQSNYRTVADWNSREALIIFSGRPLFTQHFWMTNRYVNGTDCATFGQNGEIIYDSVIADVPYLKPVLSYYWGKTLDTFLNGMYVDTLIITGNNIWMVKFHGQTNADSITWAIWSGTTTNRSVSYNLDLGESSSYTVRQMANNSTTGSVVTTGTASNVLLTVDESPKIVITLKTSTPSTGDILRSKNRYYNN